MGLSRRAVDTGRCSHPLEACSVYPAVLIPIFLLFIAVLAYGWFYWQRAKARDAARHSTTEAPTEQ
jgi:hypothetical protein